MNEIHILWNTVPAVYDKRATAEAGVRAGIGSRPGTWTATLDEPQDASRWDISVRAPSGREWTFAFDGPDEQTFEFIAATIDRAVE